MERETYTHDLKLTETERESENGRIRNVRTNWCDAGKEEEEDNDEKQEKINFNWGSGYSRIK